MDQAKAGVRGQISNGARAPVVGNREMEREVGLIAQTRFGGLCSRGHNKERDGEKNNAHSAIMRPAAASGPITSGSQQGDGTAINGERERARFRLTVRPPPHEHGR